MAFEGWKGDFVGSFRGLELDNSKRFFDAHRSQYEVEVRGKMEELAAELEPALGPAKIFRINRDVRFSADKSPYKTNLGSVAGRVYLHLDARMFYMATGAHHPMLHGCGATGRRLPGRPVRSLRGVSSGCVLPPCRWAATK